MANVTGTFTAAPADLSSSEEQRFIHMILTQAWGYRSHHRRILVGVEWEVPLINTQPHAICIVDKKYRSKLNTKNEKVVKSKL